MDDNPWGRDPSPILTPVKSPSPPLFSSQPDSSSTQHSSTRIAPPEASDGRGEGWAHADEEEVTARATVVDGEDEAGHAHSTKAKGQERIGAEVEQRETNEEKVTGEMTTHGDEEEGEEAPQPPTLTTSHALLSLDQDQGPPMDDFDDDESPAPTPAVVPGAATTTTNGSTPKLDAFDDDDFDDFGEAAGAGQGGADDDDDDFGDFGGDDDAFGTAHPTVVPIAALPATPIASTSGLPPLRLDFSDPTKEALAPQLADFFAELYPGADRAVSDEPERQVEGIGQVLVGESSRGLLAQLSSLPPLRPLDWRRSKIRREHLIALGVPINLDDSADAKPLASLVLPSLRTASPTLRSSSPSRASAPAASLSPLPFTSSPHPSRPSTPSEERRKLAAIPPPLDRKRAKEIVAMQQGDLTLLSLKELKGVKEEIEKISMEASEVLTHALLMREKEVGDGETYHGMIQDLVSAAARMKTTSASLSRSGSSSTTSRWGRKSSGNQNAPSPVR